MIVVPPSADQAGSELKGVVSRARRPVKAVLDRAHVPATVRLTRGRDIEAACGQLASAPKARQDVALPAN